MKTDIKVTVEFGLIFVDGVCFEWTACESRPATIERHFSICYGQVGNLVDLGFTAATDAPFVGWEALHPKLKARPAG
jgi:hypothetical protein